ncbi:MAG: hypothetical protein ACI8QZ_002297 [Chlamydiales bacterium]|jgi:uncharacterized protein (DUF983 family)
MDPNAPDEPVTNRDWRLFLRRVLGRHCPRCGVGELFVSRMRLAQECSDCSLVYRREAGGMTGQMYLTAIVSEIFAAGLILAIFFGTDLKPAASIGIGLPLVVGFSYWFLPKGMALWVAIEFITDIANREPGIGG